MEDLYRPYKQKRRTRATVAREKGLEPSGPAAAGSGPGLPGSGDRRRRIPWTRKRVWRLLADALQGANDIVAELLSDDAAIRKTLRELLRRQGPAAQSGRHGGGHRLPPVL